MKKTQPKCSKENFFKSKKDIISKSSKQPTIEVVSNCFNIEINKFQMFQQYSVHIFFNEDQDKVDEQNHKIPEAIPKDSREKRKQVMLQYEELIIQKLGFYVLTGQQIFCIYKSKNDDNYVLSLNENEYCIKLKLTNQKIKLKDITNDSKSKRPLTQIINSFIKEILSKQNFLEWGNNKKYFNPKFSKVLPHYSLKIYRGCTFKADIYEDGIKLVVNPCFKFIHMKNLYQDFLDRDVQSDFVNDYFKEKSVYAIYNQKMFQLDGVDLTMNLDSPFPDENFKDFKSYYQKNYNIKFKYSEQFLVYKIQEGSQQRLYYPPEILMPTGLTGKMMNDTQFMKQLAKHTIKDPKENMQFIKNSLQNLDFKKNRALKLKIDLNNNTVDAIKMESPKFLKKGKKSYINKQFQINEFYQSKNLDNWLFFYDFKNKSNSNIVMQNFMKIAQKLKYNITEPQKYLMEKHFTTQSLQKVFKKLKKRPQMVLFLMDRKLCNILYKKLKIFLNKKGVQSQCFVNFNKYKDSKSLKKFYNLLTQISVKSGSTPWALDFNIKNCVLMGFDVFHQRNKKSVASLVSFFGKNYTKQHCSTKMQKGGVEVMKNIVELFKEHMDIIEDKCKTLPDKIIFYRDGVGEGQIEIIKEEEMQRILNYLQDKYGDNKPKLTFLLITKRIEQRFLLQNNKGISNPNQGIVICNKIIKSDRPNFYMISNNVNQGTAVPTHYDIILDQNDFKLQDLMQMTYSLTHYYFNWTGTVKVPAMAQYAHKQAYQMGLYQEDQIHKKMKNSLFFL